MEGDGLPTEGIASYYADATWGYRRRSFVGELPTWGGGAVVDLSVEPAGAGSVGGSVFPAASAGMMAGAPAAAGTRGAASAPAVVGGFGGNVFPAESVGIMADTPAVAGSSGATFQAASSAVRPPPAIAFASDDHEDYQVRRMLVDSCFCAAMLASVFTVLAFRYCVTHVGSAGRPHSLYSRSLLFSSGSFSTCVILFPTGLYLDRTADDYPAVENHRGGVVLVMRL